MFFNNLVEKLSAQFCIKLGIEAKKRILPKNLFQPIVINVGINLLQSTQSRKYAKINPQKNPLKPNFCMGLVEKMQFLLKKYILKYVVL